MPRASNFKKTDLTRATRAVLAAGLEIARVETEKDGRIIVFSGKPPEAQSTNGEHADFKPCAFVR